MVCFFFSSRRRHRRSLRDWSSDVCSPDLVAAGLLAWVLQHPCEEPGGDDRHSSRQPVHVVEQVERMAHAREPDQIGRASCRERVYTPAGAVSVKNKNRSTNRRHSTTSYTC